MNARSVANLRLKTGILTSADSDVGQPSQRSGGERRKQLKWLARSAVITLSRSCWRACPALLFAVPAGCPAGRDRRRLGPDRAGRQGLPRRGRYLHAVPGAEQARLAEGRQSRSCPAPRPWRTRQRPAQVLAHLAQAPLLPLARRAADQSHPRSPGPRNRRIKRLTECLAGKLIAWKVAVNLVDHQLRSWICHRFDSADVERVRQNHDGPCGV